MNRAIAALHGRFGRACVYSQSRCMATHAHREAHLIFYLGGQRPILEVSGNLCLADHDRAIAVNAFEPHNITYQDADEECLLLLLYIDPAWFLEVGQQIDGTLRFGTAVIDVNPAVQQRVETIGNLLFDGDHCDRFDGLLFELTRACYQQSWHRAAHTRVRASADVAVRDHRVRQSIRLMQASFTRFFSANVGIPPTDYRRVAHVA